MESRPNEPLNLYQQADVNLPAQIVGTKESLLKLIDILVRAIDDGIAVGDMYNSGVEAYELQVLCLPTLFDMDHPVPATTFNSSWAVLQLPYRETSCQHHPTYLVTTHKDYEKAVRNKTGGSYEYHLVRNQLDEVKHDAPDEQPDSL